MAQPQSVAIGVFLPSDTQFIDTACIDVLGMMSREYLSHLSTLIPTHVAQSAPSVTFMYIALPGQSTVQLTTGLKILPTHDITHADVQPGKLDILFIPGQDPNVSFPPEVGRFVREHFESGKTDVLSVCTGIYVVGAAGLLEGRQASGPRGLQGDIAKRFKGVKLVGERYRWVRDGRLWSSGGTTNGNELMAAYARSGTHFPGPVAEIGCTLADVGDRGQFYSQGQTAFTFGVVWQIVKAWFVGGRTKEE